MSYHVPRSSISLMGDVYFKVFPQVNMELSYWKRRAERIPDPELRTQALASISSKRFHCQGGGVYAILAGKRSKEAIQFIVAYQTISDYLDNLCDRSTSLDPADFGLLHQSMIDALTPSNTIKNYYELRIEQDDGGYLNDLVKTCQKILKNAEGFDAIQVFLGELCGLYSDLQVHKHVTHEERIPRLTNWFAQHKDTYPQLRWYEFSAAAGSTLGIFCLVSYMLGGQLNEKIANEVYLGYFPFMQSLHILLDYYIDQQEDQMESDLNFCTYYADDAELKGRLQYFIEETRNHVKHLPNPQFHEMVRCGLVGLYLGDRKVNEVEGGMRMRKVLLRASGAKAHFFHWNTRLYYKMSGK
ncbi:tetraprenyl-beta-curcumene synthase family protein [Virgibacillus flavescens]|uniref:tetraprenyl-beta-curcumene synthase family protein n=1 Tax=Virgibacillus flavescens TaxID=1611422 RepID=UPI003D3557BF